VLPPVQPPSIIDLTSAPTPPPPSMPMQQQQVPAHGNLPPDLPLKTPVCIGQLQVTALVLYPISYLSPSDHGGPDAEWATVRTQYAHDSKKPLPSQETIHIRSPNWRNHLGENIVGENFGVVEQKVATALGPMLGKGLIRVEARVRRGRPNVSVVIVRNLCPLTHQLAQLPILPLILLVYTPKGNIQVVGNFLREQGLLLDHPELPADIQRVSQCFYYNPHNPPPGGHARAKEAANGGGSANGGRLGYSGVGVSQQSRWSAPAVSGKSVEVQRNQADELFKHLQTGEELAETEAPPEVKTQLYPHQKKAVTFLLERERERMRQGGVPSSLWQAKPDPFSQRMTWQHMVTSKEVHAEPAESKGAILADDMGLGKTITTVALIASTLHSAYAFAAQPVPQPPPPPPRPHDTGLTAAHFAGAVWGMPDVLGGGASSMSAKELAKANREADRLESEYARACRLKVKSRGTLIVCPLSTISNWEDQFREHWNGTVTVVGGNGISSTVAAAVTASPAGPSVQRTNSSALCSMGPLTQSLLATEGGQSPEQCVGSSAPATGAQNGNGVHQASRPCRVYVYHGNARRPDPAFLADFDAVITTYATLATEFSKQSKSVNSGDGDDDESCASDLIEVDELGNQLTRPASAKKGVKRKKCTGGQEVPSPLQSVCWFRIVLDEAQ
jgi:SWI/SNF-related matrix-associated actin-dependent regulator of chromatin subfamily A3